MSIFHRILLLNRAVKVAKQETNVVMLKVLETWEVANGLVCKRDFSDKQRKNAAKTGEAMPDGSFPIGNVEDLHNAIMLLHNAKDPSEAKDHIMRRATALGAEGELPLAWGAGKAKKPVKKDGADNEPGDATDPDEDEDDITKAAAIVATVAQIQKDWAEFDANRRSVTRMSPGAHQSRGEAHETLAKAFNDEGNKKAAAAHDDAALAHYTAGKALMQTGPNSRNYDSKHAEATRLTTVANKFARDTNLTMDHLEFNKED